MNVWNKFNKNISNVCQDISLSAKTVNLLGAQEEKSGKHQRVLPSSIGDHEQIQLVDKVTNIAVHRALLLAWLKNTII